MRRKELIRNLLTQARIQSLLGAPLVQKVTDEPAQATCTVAHWSADKPESYLNKDSRSNVQ